MHLFLALKTRLREATFYSDTDTGAMLKITEITVLS